MTAPPDLDARHANRFRFWLLTFEERTKWPEGEVMDPWSVQVRTPDGLRTFPLRTPADREAAALAQLNAEIAQRETAAIARVDRDLDDLTRARGISNVSPSRAREGAQAPQKDTTQTPSGRMRRYPLPGDRSGDLLRAAPGELRSRGYEPAPKPYRPRRWRSYVWVGVADGGRMAIALPVPNLDLAELERKIGNLTAWSLRSGRDRGVRPDVIFPLIPADEPVQVQVRRVGLKPRIEVVRVRGVRPRDRPKALKPFRHELRIAVFWEGDHQEDAT